MEFIIRRTGAVIDEVVEENGVKLEKPIRKVAVFTVIKNPYVGTVPDSLSELIEWCGWLGEEMGKRAVELLGGSNKVESFGKGAIVGEQGEIELGAAAIHTKFGLGLRRAIGRPCKSIIPGTQVRGGMGTIITIPMCFIEAMRVRSHYDSMEFRAEASPRSDELLIVLALADGGRPLARIGGLTIHDYKGDDGLN